MQRSEIWVIGRNLLLTTSHHIVGTEIEKLTQISEEKIEFPEKYEIFFSEKCSQEREDGETVRDARQL